ncbi:MAG: monovalent cation/H(+) antiporter subunit G [Bacillota bacterium]
MEEPVLFFRELVASIILLSGLFFFIVGTIGLLRMPDVYSRMHATTKCDTLGVSLIMLGIMLGYGLTMITMKLFLVIIFIWLTTPTAAHAIARAAYDTHEISRTDIPLWNERKGQKND